MGIEEVAIRAQEQERERIALELHDGVAQTLTSALRYLQTLEAMAPQELAESRRTVGRTRYLVRHALQEVREVIYSLHPAALSRLGLVAPLRQELGRLREETGWQVDFAAEEMPFSKEEELALYRIIHEAMTNARKHSQTRHLWVALRREGGLIIGEVRDWGKGFVRSGVTTGRGLDTMRRRAEILKGQLFIECQPGRGTYIRVEMPEERMGCERGAY